MQSLKPGTLIKIYRNPRYPGADYIATLYKECPVSVLPSNGCLLYSGTIVMYLGLCENCKKTYKILYEDCIYFTDKPPLVEIELAEIE